MRKKIISVLAFLLVLNFYQSANANIIDSNITDGLMFKPALTADYQTMDLNGDNQNLKSRVFEQQLKNFDNIVLGLNLRVHEYLGFNLNWSKNTLKDSNSTFLDISNFNATSVLYFPLIGDNWLEGFAELGAADISGAIKYGNQKNKFHETALVYGAGIQFAPYDFDIAFRLGFQKYHTNLGDVGAKITAFRAGVVMPF